MLFFLDTGFTWKWKQLENDDYKSGKVIERKGTMNNCKFGYTEITFSEKKITDRGKELKSKIYTSWYYLRQLGWLQFLGGNHRKNKVYFKDSLREDQKPQNMSCLCINLRKLVWLNCIYIKNLCVNYYLPLVLIFFNVGTLQLIHRIHCNRVTCEV